MLKDELQCIENANRNRHLAYSNTLYPKTTEAKVNEDVEIASNSNGEGNSNSWIDNLELKHPNSISRRSRMKHHQFRKIRDLKLAFSEFYLMLIFLKNYQTLNFTGFCKILQKYDTLFETTSSNQWR